MAFPDQKKIKNQVPNFPSTYSNLTLSLNLSDPSIPYTKQEPQNEFTLQFSIPTLRPPAKMGFAVTSSRFVAAPIRRPSAGLSGLSGSNRSAASKVQSIKVIGREFAIRRRLIIISPKATSDQPGFVIVLLPPFEL